MIKFKTRSGSVYEVDPHNKTVTRLSEIPFVNMRDEVLSRIVYCEKVDEISGIEVGGRLTAFREDPPLYLVSTTIVEVFI